VFTLPLLRLTLLYNFSTFTLGLLIQGFAKDSIKRGDVFYKPAQGELKLVKSFTAEVKVFDIPGEMKVGYSPVMYCGTNNDACKMTKINWKRTGTTKVLDPPSLKMNDYAEVVFTPTKPFFLEIKPEDGVAPLLSRLVFRDMRTIVMVGAVRSVTTTTSVERGVLKPFVPQVLGSVTNDGMIVNSNSIKVKAAAAAAVSDSGKLMTKQVIVADHGLPVSQLYPAAVVDHNKVGLPGGHVAKSKLWCLCCINRWWLSKQAVEGVNDSPLLVTCAGWDNEEDGHSDCVKLLD
jgi:hypothetical protein